MLDLVKNTTIYLRVTGLCNSNCEFCYRDSRDVYGEDLKTVKKIIDKIKNFGFERLGILGGEVFLRPDAPQIFEYAHKKKFKISFATNGLAFTPKRIDILNKCIQWLGLPLDGATPKDSAKIRSSFDQFKTTVNLLKYFKKHKPNFKIKISTLVSKINKNNIIDIGKVLFQARNLYQPDAWRLLKFLDLGQGKKNKKKFFISEKEFSQIASQTIKKFSNLSNVSRRHNVSRTNSVYLIISARSRILKSKGNQYFDCGDFKNISKQKFMNLIGESMLWQTTSNNMWRVEA
ncbi:MAG: radical SAM protein [bacterium]